MAEMRMSGAGDGPRRDGTPPPILRRTQGFEVPGGDAGAVRPWEEYNAATLIELSCTVPAAQTFRAREVNLQLDQVHLAHVTGTAHRVHRDRPMVDDRPGDAIAAYAALRGEVQVEHGGVRTVMRPGQMLICDVDTPFFRHFGRGVQELVVKVPRTVLTELTGAAEVTPVVVDTATAAHAKALVRLAGQAVASPVPVPADEQAAIELVAVLAGDGRVRSSIAYRAAARSFIADHLTDPTLSATDVAAAVGISERQLSRILAEAGTSVPRHVLARRLDLAYGMLTGTTTGVRATDVAARCGFTSTTYFSTVFKRRFGVTARDAMRWQPALTM
ncbi:helix-turn-helix domain-containing protein [Gordonia amarae]|uniref:Helix-turn-helix domain-containing protein n=2 Tax=Gordonia amarae TaxID=36821 RepID=A0A857M7D5_9ACTN|nr:helix-turn-helix domain-containing protein [Gordonia amarae]MCS3877198.1 AraC-like DNA-binding protein [Gordonia amarae]QHN15981.1 helix-turn-helix domain-containing protein [Gordonia amarae]QHN20549.1 helix-turn-helix domain-containing protein [Gordonia amarae]QHN38178.1 helix-turn-helix domain-containing protein [Gordonia amarae]GAB04974.1 putative AraC family transcriptional regulator [Gordonia amarae NBRC 15530]